MNERGYEQDWAERGMELFLQFQQRLPLALQEALKLGWPFSMVLSVDEGPGFVISTLITHWVGPPGEVAMTLGIVSPFSTSTNEDPPASGTLSI